DSGLESGHDFALHRLHPGVVEVALLSQLEFELRDRILTLPRFALSRVAGIGLPAALGMGALAVGLAFDQGRAAARPRPVDGAVCRLINREDVVAVDDDTRDAIAGSARCHIAQRMR